MDAYRRGLCADAEKGGMMVMTCELMGKELARQIHMLSALDQERK